MFDGAPWNRSIGDTGQRERIWKVNSRDFSFPILFIIDEKSKVGTRIRDLEKLNTREETETSPEDPRGDDTSWEKLSEILCYRAAA